MSNGLLTPEQRRQAMSMGLLNAGVGLLSGAYNPGGRFGPAAAQGLAGFGGAMQQAQAAALQQRQLEQEERFRTAQMQDLLMRRQMEMLKLEEERQRRERIGQKMQGLRAPAAQQPSPILPRTGAAGAALVPQLDPTRAPPVPVRPTTPLGAYDPERITTTALDIAQDDPQMANALLSGATNLRTQEKERLEQQSKETKERRERFQIVEGKPGLIWDKDLSVFKFDEDIYNKLQRGEDIGKVSTRANQIRQDFLNVSKAFKEVNDFYARIVESAKEPSAAGDLSMIFSYMKILDPTSVVREGEQATAATARGVPETVRSWYNRVLSGEKLSDAQRQDFVTRAAMIYNSALQQQQSIEGQFENIAKRNLVKPDDVVIKYRVPGHGGIYFDKSGKQINAPR